MSLNRTKQKKPNATLFFWNIFLVLRPKMIQSIIWKNKKTNHFLDSWKVPGLILEGVTNARSSAWLICVSFWITEHPKLFSNTKKMLENSCFPHQLWNNSKGPKNTSPGFECVQVKTSQENKLINIILCVTLTYFSYRNMNTIPVYLCTCLPSNLQRFVEVIPIVWTTGNHLLFIIIYYVVLKKPITLTLQLIIIAMTVTVTRCRNSSRCSSWWFDWCSSH